MPDITIELKLSEEQYAKLREVAEWECTEIEETLHDMIEMRYELFLEDYAAYPEASGKSLSKYEPDDEVPF